jgi:hypothetical protein
MGLEWGIDRDAVAASFDALQQLPENWNGYGAQRIDPAIIAAARQLIEQVPSDVVSTPQVVPMTRGRLQFEWHHGPRSLEVEFESPSQIHYLKSDSAARIEEEDVLSADDADRVLDLLRWFAAGEVNATHR